MRFFLSILFLCVFNLLVNSQEATQNSFQQSENAVTETSSSAIESQATGDGPSNPPGPETDAIPIDGFSSILVISALLLIFYVNKEKTFRTKNNYQKPK